MTRYLEDDRFGRAAHAHHLRLLRKVLRPPKQRASDRDFIRDRIADAVAYPVYRSDERPQNPAYRFDHLSEAPVG